MEQELPSSPTVLIHHHEKQTVRLIYRVEEEKEMHPHLHYSSLAITFRSKMELSLKPSSYLFSLTVRKLWLVLQKMGTFRK